MEISEVLIALESERTCFLREVHWADLFAVSYYHVTRQELEAIARGQRRFPEERTRQLVRFYSLYCEARVAWDTDRSCLEPWRHYFGLATSMGTRARVRGSLFGDPAEKAARLMEYGTHAHILCDLPRVLRESFASHSPSELQADFNAMDPFFARAGRLTFIDLDRALRRSGALRFTHRAIFEPGEWFLRRFGGGSGKVKRWRHAAWKEAALQKPPRVG
ncbi:MAG: DUF5995 family protein [Armatimonas sp.]